MATVVEVKKESVLDSLFAPSAAPRAISNPEPGSELKAVEKAKRERRRGLIVPREHGAWGLLLVPMITGAGIALRESRNLFPFVLLLTAALALFWLRTPLESFFGTSAMRAETQEERQSVAGAAAYLAIIAGIALMMLLWVEHHPLLWKIGGVAAVAFAAQALLKNLGRQPRMAGNGLPAQPRSKESVARLRLTSEIAGTIGLTASAPAAYYVMTGKFGVTGWMLWLANLLFAGDQIHYVQLRLHTARVQGVKAKLARGWAFVLGQAVMTTILTVTCVGRLMPPLASLAFAPLLFRGWFYFIQKPGPLAVRKLGWAELAHAIAFCIIFVATFSPAS
jgi:YwiC-like protein